MQHLLFMKVYFGIVYIIYKDCKYVKENMHEYEHIKIFAHKNKYRKILYNLYILYIINNCQKIRTLPGQEKVITGSVPFYSRNPRKSIKKGECLHGTLILFVNEGFTNIIAHLYYLTRMSLLGLYSALNNDKILA